jgi:hypothetical protein
MIGIVCDFINSYASYKLYGIKESLITDSIAFCHFPCFVFGSVAKALTFKEGRQFE